MNDPLPALTPRDTPLAQGTCPLFTCPGPRDGPVRRGPGRTTRGWPVMLVFNQTMHAGLHPSELKGSQEHTAASAGFQAGINTNGRGSHRRFPERDTTRSRSHDVLGGREACGMWDPDEAKSAVGVVVVGTGGRRIRAANFNPGNVSAFETTFVPLGW